MADPRLERQVERVDGLMGRAASEFRSEVIVREEGRVESMGDGVLAISGLPGAAAEEVLAVGARGSALVLGLTGSTIEAIALHEGERMAVGASVRSTGRRATLGVGDPLLGRVVDPLGRPLDGLPLGGTLKPAPLERPAPALHERTAVHTPLYTGVLAIDAMFPIGRGQRELILGEEGTGKTSLALDAMLRQLTTDVVCVYVAIGRRRSETWQVVELLRSRAGRFVVVSAPEDTTAGLRYLAPYAGTAVAEHFMYRGENALVVYDDLTAHANAWRELSLLLRRPPGREAFPGDVFYLHSRLLERAAQLSSDRGGGSLTALPIAVLEGGRLTAYIPTNLISITDGQLVTSRALFSAGHKPAIDAGLSVSRVGAKAQPQAMRELAGRLRLDYAAFLELEAFSRLGTRLEPAAERRIEIGRRVRRLLGARRLSPLCLFDEVVRLVLAAEHDLLLAIPEHDVVRVSGDVAVGVRAAHPGLVERIEREAALGERERGVLTQQIAEVVGTRFALAPPIEVEITVDAEPGT
ncbi:MAG: F0F1 ATP synthase subunit alpha [Polyangiaceae bacterium]|nr:F0F1 ATP synthase subunit alpha [Polyangiaceae bacterium]